MSHVPISHSCTNSIRVEVRFLVVPVPKKKKKLWKMVVPAHLFKPADFQMCVQSHIFSASEVLVASGASKKF